MHSILKEEREKKEPKNRYCKETFKVKRWRVKSAKGSQRSLDRKDASGMSPQSFTASMHQRSNVVIKGLPCWCDLSPPRQVKTRDHLKSYA